MDWRSRARFSSPATASPASRSSPWATSSATKIEIRSGLTGQEMLVANPARVHDGDALRQGPGLGTRDEGLAVRAILPSPFGRGAGGEGSSVHRPLALTLSLSQGERGLWSIHESVSRPLRSAARLRHRADPGAAGVRRCRLHEARAGPLSQGRFPDHHRDHPRCRARRPEDIETEITDKIEEAVNTTSGIDELRSVSSEGISQVFIKFVLEKDGDVAAQEVRDKVNRILPDLPKDIEQPIVEKFDPDSTPIMTIAVSAPPPTTIRDLTEYCDKVLRRQLESLSGVGQVMIVGGQARQINVQLDPMKLRAHQLTVADVAHALESQNLQMPGGSVKVGPTEYTLRTMGRVHSMEEMDAITVANRDGHTITIGDLGHCEDSTEELESASLYNDTPACC